jgi:hypothetical protein
MQSNERQGTKAQKFKIKPKDDIRHTSNRNKYKYHNQCKIHWSLTACLKGWHFLVLLHFSYYKTIKNNYSYYEKFPQQRATFFDPEGHHQKKVLQNLIYKRKVLSDVYGQFQIHKLQQPKKAKVVILWVLTFLWGEYEDYFLLGRDVMYLDREVSTLQWKVLPPLSEGKTDTKSTSSKLHES